MVDFEILEDIPHYGQKDESLERRYTCPAMGLFYVRGNGDIVPIAIQFHQVPSETNPIWTPNDTEMDWIYAKMWLRNADTQWHQVSISLLDHCLIPLLKSSQQPCQFRYDLRKRTKIWFMWGTTVYVSGFDNTFTTYFIPWYSNGAFSYSFQGRLLSITWHTLYLALPAGSRNGCTFYKEGVFCRFSISNTPFTPEFSSVNVKLKYGVKSRCYITLTSFC